MYPMFIGGLLVVCLIAIASRLVVIKREEQARIQQGILLTVHLKHIIDSCQKHRGNSYTAIRGNDKLESKMSGAQGDIDRVIADFDSPRLLHFPQWESFAEHWPRLKKHALAGDLKSRNLIRQHSLMIDGQLSLLDDVMRDNDLHRMRLDRGTPVSEICLDTLRVAETVGQTRAIGAGICARGVCEGAERIILDFLRLSVQSTASELVKQIHTIKNEDLQQALKQASGSISDSISKLLSMVDNRVLREGRLQVDGNDYFNTSTRAIDELLKVFGIIIHYASTQHTRII